MQIEVLPILVRAVSATVFVLLDVPLLTPGTIARVGVAAAMEVKDIEAKVLPLPLPPLSSGVEVDDGEVLPRGMPAPREQGLRAVRLRVRGVVGVFVRVFRVIQARLSYLRIAGPRG